jgi:hypothetical protein
VSDWTKSSASTSAPQEGDQTDFLVEYNLSLGQDFPIYRRLLELQLYDEYNQSVVYLEFLKY